MLLTTRSHWARWADPACRYNLLPYVRGYRLAPGEDRVYTWRRAWEEASDCAFVLESGKDGRYTYLGLRPAEVIRGKGETAVIRAAGDDGEAEPDAIRPGETRAGATPAEGAREKRGIGENRSVVHGKPLDVVRSWIGRFRAPAVEGAPPWIGGCVGYWAYDVVRTLEKLPVRAADDLALPDYVFLRMDELWIVDHAQGVLYCAVHAPRPEGDEPRAWEAAYDAAARRAERMKAVWDRIVAAGRSPEAEAARARMRKAIERDRLQPERAPVEAEALPGVRLATTRKAFVEAVERIRQYIAQGDVFQVNLSLRQSRELRASAADLYEWLRLVNPSPYMGLLKLPDVRLVSASPELLVKLERGRLSTRPIAGTRRRGRTPDEDRRLAAELLGNSKERAEHLMLVDLERNDLGRVARYGTVRVPELMTVERYSHVMHLVSQVEGELAPGKDAFDALAAMFPGGTITGAPKIRTMEIIEELEPVRRGPYTGSLGWIDYTGNMEFNIIIRTVTIKDGVAHIQAGAGIVIDSEPEREYRECLNKVKALWKAVQYAEHADMLRR